MATYAEELEQVQEAITKVMNGQAYTITTPTGSRSVTRADLASLTAREKWLRREVENESKGGSMQVMGGTPV